jgi:hypothetical protein
MLKGGAQVSDKRPGLDWTGLRLQSTCPVDWTDGLQQI